MVTSTFGSAQNPPTTKNGRRPKIGLVLQGGGALGLAHVVSLSAGVASHPRGLVAKRDWSPRTSDGFVTLNEDIETQEVLGMGSLEVRRLLRFGG
jgi:hypothetical protein